MRQFRAVVGKKICIILKDAGRPFNPVLPASRNTLESFDEKLGLALVNNVYHTIAQIYVQAECGVCRVQPYFPLIL